MQVTKLVRIEDLERKLRKEKDLRQRLLLLDELTAYLVFTNVQKAQTLLADLRTALEYFPNRDIELHYHTNTALVENQLYNYILAEKHLTEALGLVQEMGAISQQIDIFIDYTGLLINLRRNEDAYTYLSKATNLLESVPDDRLLARKFCREGYLELYNRKYEQAIDLFLQAEQLLQTTALPLELKDHYFLTLIYSGLGIVYKEVNELHKCVQAYLKVLDLCTKYEMKTRLSWHFLNVGDAYLSMGQVDMAQTYLQKAIEVPDDINLSSRAGASANLGYCHYLKEEYAQALKLYKRAEKLYNKENDNDIYSQLFRIERWKAALYSALKKENKTQKHLIKAFKYAQKADEPRLLTGILRDIANYYAKHEEYENAYEYQRLHTQSLERFYQQSADQKVLALEIKYGAEKRAREAEMLRLQATRLQLKALRAQMNPHFMHNALNSIQRYIMSNDSDTASQFLARFAKLMRQSLEYSDMESISLEKEMEFLEDYLHINQGLRFGDLQYNITTTQDIEEDIMGVPTMIIQPYVENAIEHGLRNRKNAYLRVHFSLLDQDTILCEVLDNGIGRAEAAKLQALDEKYKSHKSKGTNITEHRLQLLQSSHNFALLSVNTFDLFDDKTGDPAGTKVHIRLPIVDTKIK